MKPRRLRHLLPGIAVLLAIAAGPGPAVAQSPVQLLPPGSGAETLARAAVEQLIRALGLALQALPQYDMPRLNERGDIIIKRLNPPDPGPPVTRRPAVPGETAT